MSEVSYAARGSAGYAPSITAYRLKKDVPGYKKGTIWRFSRSSLNSYDACFMPEEQSTGAPFSRLYEIHFELNKDWFEPIKE